MISTMLRVILRPAFNGHGARLHGKFVITLDGRQLCISRQPLLDAARVLINEGIDPATPIATRHAGSGFDAMTSTVGTAAKWTVREDSTVSPTFVRWKAFSRDDVQSPMRFDERPDTGDAAGRIFDADRVSTTRRTVSRGTQLRRSNPLVARINQALAAMSEGRRSLRLQHHEGRPRWSLSNVQSAAPERWLPTSPQMRPSAPAGDALFADMPGQSRRLSND